MEYLYLSSFPNIYSYTLPSSVNVPSGSTIRLSLEPCLKTTMLNFNYKDFK